METRRLWSIFLFCCLNAVRSQSTKNASTVIWVNDVPIRLEYSFRLPPKITHVSEKNESNSGSFLVGHENKRQEDYKSSLELSLGKLKHGRGSAIRNKKGTAGGAVLPALHRKKHTPEPLQLTDGSRDTAQHLFIINGWGRTWPPPANITRPTSSKPEVPSPAAKQEEDLARQQLREGTERGLNFTHGWRRTTPSPANVTTPMFNKPEVPLPAAKQEVDLTRQPKEGKERGLKAWSWKDIVSKSQKLNVPKAVFRFTKTNPLERLEPDDKDMDYIQP